MWHFAILALFAAPPISQQDRYPSNGSAQQRFAFEQNREKQAAFEERLFTEAGFQPLAEVGAEGRSVRRVLFSDPYMMMSPAGIEVERSPGGSVILRLVSRGGRSQAAPLAASAWAHLTSLEGSLFVPKPYVPWDPPKADDIPSSPPPICHGWIVRLGKADETGLGRNSWSQCGSREALPFAVEMARLAVSTRTSCEFDPRNPFSSFSACFSGPPRP